MDLLEGIRAFVATAQTGSFTAAAERLGVSNRLTSKYVAELEQRLGVRLLQRTTRKVGLTPAGEDLLSRAPALLDELDDLVAGLGEEGRGLSGILRVSAPVTFGEVFLQDMLRRFAEPHPDLIIDLRLSDRYVDLATEGIDLAFRIGAPRVSALRARKLAEVRSRIVASPDYLARNAAPEEPADLSKHACILDTNRAFPARWEVLDGAQVVPVEVKGRFLVNSARAARDLALAGCGVAFCPDFVLADDLAQGRLVALLPDFETPRRPLNVIYLDGPVLPRKVRALIDFAVREMK
ncbi:LysR family transcriptional regulator [Sinirhodobacter sp. WL0062]|uniref:LysR family transcriptional regulator n=1 Tax=Rhodobacter flavimaris TaxID=2907145 RepID=A0ABS8YXW7_9RHOB|nr:LysR family transcriptional regulator [Sinirhodobacter sp. WL0062]MCE5974318.1 LysR family transcriptional regulator [Sinirhodobacter sp. WL0062]